MRMWHKGKTELYVLHKRTSILQKTCCPLDLILFITRKRSRQAHLSEHSRMLSWQPANSFLSQELPVTLTHFANIHGPFSAQRLSSTMWTSHVTWNGIQNLPWLSLFRSFCNEWRRRRKSHSSVIWNYWYLILSFLSRRVSCCVSSPPSCSCCHSHSLTSGSHILVMHFKK